LAFAAGRAVGEDLKCALPKPPLRLRRARISRRRGEVGESGFFAILVEHLVRQALSARSACRWRHGDPSHAIGALLRLEVLLVAVVDQRVEANRPPRSRHRRRGRHCRRSTAELNNFSRRNATQPLPPSPERI